MKSSPPPLRRLLQRRPVAAWLATFQQLDPALQLALVTPAGDFFAATAGWPASVQAAAPPVTHENVFWRALGRDARGAFLALYGGDAPPAGIAEAVAQGVGLLLREATVARGVAAEALERYREINLLYRVSENIGATLDSAAILPQILDEAHQVIDADFGVVALLAEETGWYCAAAAGAPVENEALTPLLTSLAPAKAEKADAAILTDLSAAWRALGVSVLIWAPLTGPSGLLGGVVLARYQERALFVANDRKLLAALASQAAIALEKANLFHETRTAAQHLRALNSIGRELAGTLEVEPLLQQILRAALDLVQGVEGSLVLVETPEKPAHLLFRVGEGGAQRLVGTRLPAGTGVVGQVAATGEAMIVNEAQDNEFWSDTVDKSTGFVTQSLLAVPMIRNDLVVGVLEVVNTRDGRLFRQQDVDRLTSLAPCNRTISLW